MVHHPGKLDERRENIRTDQLLPNPAAPGQHDLGNLRVSNLQQNRLPSDRSISTTSSSKPAAAQITPPPQELVRRQAVVVSTDVDLIVENGAGSTIAEATLQGLPTTPVDVPLPIGTLSLPALVNAPDIISLPADDLNTNSAPSPASTGTPSLSIQVPGSSSQIVLSSPPTPAPSDSTTFSLPLPSSSAFPSIATFNSTTASSLLPKTSLVSFTTNSTTSTHSSTLQTTFVTSTTSQSSRSSSISLSTTSSFATSTNIPATNTGGAGGVGVGGGSATSAAPSATSTTAVAPTSQSSVNAPVIGGVLGGLAGLALLLLAALFFLRRYKKRRRAAESLPPGGGEGVPPSTSHSGAPMAQNPAAPWGAALGPLMRRMRPNSTFTAATTDTGTSERGFQKISGRKIESVLVSGGDGYGGRGPGAGNLSGQSFYRDSSGTYGGGQSQNSSMVVGPASPRKSAATSDFTDMSGIAGPSTTGRGSDKEVVTVRPGPARQPVTSPAYTFSPHFPGSEPVPPSSERGYSPGPTQGLRAPDPIGRSRPSFDGSRGSKFAEDLQ